MKTWLMLGGLLACQAASADVDCFTIYGPRNQTVYRATATPIDLSGSIGDEMRKRWPGHHLVWTKDENCRAVNGAITTRADADAYSSGLLAQPVVGQVAQIDSRQPLAETRAHLEVRKAGTRAARGRSG